MAGASAGSQEVAKSVVASEEEVSVDLAEEASAEEEQEEAGRRSCSLAALRSEGLAFHSPDLSV
jgi:hypothetical protein